MVAATRIRKRAVSFSITCVSAVLQRSRLPPAQASLRVADASNYRRLPTQAAEKPKAKGFGAAKTSPEEPGTAMAADGTRANSGVEAPGGGYWTDVKLNIEELKDRPADVPGKAIILANNKAICLFMYKSKVYCTAGNGTAYEYPLFDSELFDGADGKPVIRCKFDQTSYSLVRVGAPHRASPFVHSSPDGGCARGRVGDRRRRAATPQETGKVIEWCPKEDSPLSVRNMLSTLKKVCPALPRVTGRLRPSAPLRPLLAPAPRAPASAHIVSSAAARSAARDHGGAARKRQEEAPFVWVSGRAHLAYWVSFGCPLGAGPQPDRPEGVPDASAEGRPHRDPLLAVSRAMDDGVAAPWAGGAADLSGRPRCRAGRPLPGHTMTGQGGRAVALLCRGRERTPRHTAARSGEPAVRRGRV